MIVKILMNSKSHRVTNTENSPENIRAESQMSHLAQELQAVLFRLYRVFLRISLTRYDHLLRLNLTSLPTTRTFHEHSFHVNSRPGRNFLHHLLGHLLHINHHLYIINRRAVIQRDKIHLFITAFGSYPTFNLNLFTAIS